MTEKIKNIFCGDCIDKKCSDIYARAIANAKRCKSKKAYTGGSVKYGNGKTYEVYVMLREAQDDRRD